MGETLRNIHFDRKRKARQRDRRTQVAPITPGERGEIRETAPAYLALSSTLAFRLDATLADRLRLAARARHRSPEAMAAELLSRGLDREALRARAEAALASLTPREQEVSHFISLGHTNRQIALALVISSETVKSHVRNTLHKLGLRSKTELRLLMQELGHELCPPAPHNPPSA